jgi:hypothetical protein
MNDVYRVLMGELAMIYFNVDLLSHHREKLYSTPVLN